MPEPASLTLFLAAAFVLLVTPGPAVLFIVARSADLGRRAGIVSALGVNAGALFHVAAAALGVSALVLSSALAFNLLKLAGAGYLIYLGVRRLSRPEEPALERSPLDQGLRRTFWEGVVVNVTNPKTALFFAASCRSSSIRRGAASRPKSSSWA